MARYTDFEDQKKNVKETWSSMALLLEKFDWKFFTEEAAIQVEAYEILDDAFDFADDSADFVKLISDEIDKLEEKIKLQRKVGSKTDADDSNALLKYLVKYVHFNFPEDLWKESPEFDNNHYVWGCR